MYHLRWGSNGCIELRLFRRTCLIVSVDLYKQVTLTCFRMPKTKGPKTTQTTVQPVKICKGPRNPVSHLILLLIAGSTKRRKKINKNIPLDTIL